MVVLVVVLLIAALVGLAARYLWYWGPLDTNRDFAAELYDLSLQATGRDEFANSQDWARFTLLGQAYDDTLAAFEASGAYPVGAADFAVGLLDPDSSEWVVEEDDWDENLDGYREDVEIVPPEVRLAASRAMVEAFRAQGGFDRLDEVAQAIEQRGVPVRETIGPISIDYALPELQPMREVVRLLTFDAHDLVARGEHAAAVDRVESTSVLARGWRAQNFLFEWLFGLAIEAAAYEQIEMLAQDPAITTETIRRLGAIPQDPPRDFESVVRGDGLWARASLASSMGVGGRFVLSSSEAQSAQVDRLVDAAVRLHAGDPAAPRELENLTDLVEHDWRYLAASTAIPAYDAAVQASKRLEAARTRVKIILAIEGQRRASGTLPESLDDIAGDAGLDASGFSYERTESHPGYTITHPDIPVPEE